MEPMIYRGTLRHRRFRPVEHAFTYPLFMVLLDIDRIEQTMACSPLTSYNRWNWASFDDRDHFGDPRRPLRHRVARDAARNGVDLPDGPIYLLTHLRYLGYAFNPVSFYYCYDAAGSLRAVLAEVNNTFGGRQNYWLTDRSPTAAGRDWTDRSALRRYRCRKAMYVSPFMGMDQLYTFALSEPRKQLVAHVTVETGDVTTFDATLTLDGIPWSSSALAQALAIHPFMSGKVIAAIHWEALKLYWKGVPVVARPPNEAPEVAGRRVLG